MTGILYNCISHSSTFPVDTTTHLYNNTRVVYALPRTVSARKAKGIVFLAYGCGHSAKDWEDKGGLPVEQRIVKHVVDQGLIAFAVSGTGRSHCWRKEDVSRVRAGYRFLQRKLKLYSGEMALYAIGCSSGGSLVSVLPRHITVSGVGIIAAVARNNVLRGRGATDMHPKYPPAAFVSFQRDPTGMDRIRENIKTLKRMRVPTAHFTARSKVIDPPYFYLNSVTVSKKTSQAIYEAFLEKDIIDSNGWLKQDPRLSLWRDALANVSGIENDNLQLDKSPISELMNVAWAQHELTAEFVPEILDFFLAAGRRARPT